MFSLILCSAQLRSALIFSCLLVSHYVSIIFSTISKRVFEPLSVQRQTPQGPPGCALHLHKDRARERERYIEWPGEEEREREGEKDRNKNERERERVKCQGRR